MSNRVPQLLMVCALAMQGLGGTLCGALPNRVDFNNDGTVNVVDAIMMADDWLDGLTEAGLVAHWQLNENAGASAADRVGGHTGGLVGSPAWSPDEGLHDGSLLLIYGQYVQATGYKGISGTAPRSCSVWIKTYMTYGVIVSWGTTSAEAKWMFHLDDGRLRATVGGGYAIGSTSVGDNEWHRVTVVCDGTATDNIKFYIDGVLDPLSDFFSAGIDTGSALDVCIGQFNGGTFFTGYVDDVRIYDRVLTAEELAQPGVDLNDDFRINLDDFKILGDNWLWQTPSVLLAENGVATLPIILRSTLVSYDWGRSCPTTGEPQVVFELEKMLEEITGAPFEVVYDGTGTATEGIFVGTLEDFPEFAVTDPTIAPALEIRGKFFDGVESYIIRTEPGQLIILGATPLGVSHGVSAFLESLGYRQFFPGQKWEIIPSLPTLNVSLNVGRRPDFLVLTHAYGNFDEDCADERLEWDRRNRMGQSLPLNIGHIYWQIIEDNQALFDAHPEYYPLVDGARRTTGQPGLCVSNPAVVQICKDWAIQYFVDNPQEVMVSMEPSDTSPYCQCGVGDVTGGNCDAIGTDDPLVNSTAPDLVYYLANEVAKAVEAAFPGQNKLVGLLSYSGHSDIPTFQLEDNIYVLVARIWVSGEHSYEDLVELWPQVAGGAGYYEYWSVFWWSMDLLGDWWLTSTSYLTKMFKTWHDSSPEAPTVQAEASNSWASHGRGYYLTSRLRWDVDTDVDALLNDFHTKAFGPAAPAMKSFYDHIDASINLFIDDHLMSLIFRDLETATTAAAGDPMVLARLEDLKLYLRYVHLHWMLKRATAHQEREDLSLEILTLSYRARYRYMFDWGNIGSWWLWGATHGDDAVGDPDIWANSNPDAPWRDPCEFSSAEIESYFQEGLAYFPLLGVVEIDFSDDVVPVRFESYSSAANTQDSSWMGTWGTEGMRYGMYSFAGENLDVQIKTPVYVGQPDLYWRIEDPCGTFIVDGYLPNDYGVWQNLSIPVPGPGPYRLYTQDTGGGWSIRTQVDMPLSVKMADVQTGNQNRAVWYFYVPVGTTTVYYFPEKSRGTHEVRGPNNELIATVTGDGTTKTVAVPAGLDGKVWSMDGGYGQRGLWFYNCPNWISASRNALMVPRDVALSDGLDIR